MKYPKHIEHLLDANKNCIIIWEDKRWNWYIDATGHEKWDAAMLWMLRQRVKAGYILSLDYVREYAEEQTIPITMTQDQIDAIPDAEVRKMASDRLDYAVRNNKRLAASVIETEELYRALETNNPHLAYRALMNLQEAEYQGWDWEIPIDPTAPDEP